MNISSRFTEFGMTGAFFWIGQMIFLSFFITVPAQENSPSWISLWNAYLSMLPKGMEDVPGSLLTVFGVIGIFVTGLILDLLGSYFALWELTIFNRHIKTNQDWLNALAAECPETIRQDYEALRDNFGTGFFVTYRKLRTRLGMSRQCKNIQTFLFSYIHVFSELSDMLVDNMHLWRTSRAISTTLLLLAFEVIYLNIHGNLSDLAYILANVLLFAISALLTLRSYSRLCFSLFSLACATRKKSQS